MGNDVPGGDQVKDKKILWPHGTQLTYLRKNVGIDTVGNFLSVFITQCHFSSSGIHWPT